MSTFTFFSENDKFGDPSHASTLAAGPAPPPTNKYKKRFHWAGQYAPSDEHLGLNARSTASELPISHLRISPEERKRIEEMYRPVRTASCATPPLVDCIYTLDDTSQLEAAGVLAQYNLDPESQEDLGNRWSHQWSFRSKNVKEETRRILYLCECGYDHHQRETKYDRSEREGTRTTISSSDQCTHSAFRECGASIDVILLSRALSFETVPTTYTIRLGFSGVVTCELWKPGAPR
ncbi:hypothetical protein C8R45DRAFT_1106997 [Mycena sanguinolenta]|nr:hypothetical protein C8R45DRAFT_1106997 [Mycena sanguinolenta]